MQSAYDLILFPPLITDAKTNLKKPICLTPQMNPDLKFHNIPTIKTALHHREPPTAATLRPPPLDQKASQHHPIVVRLLQPLPLAGTRSKQRRKRANPLTTIDCHPSPTTTSSLTAVAAVGIPPLRPSATFFVPLSPKAAGATSDHHRRSSLLWDATVVAAADANHSRPPPTHCNINRPGDSF
ncbi:unnamed protein product [Lactuca virosa]|uniref:Uncharacterized protein n=1 Tax=Lactuca virosa TaxID=75947 RepID=A0AAU9NUT1_9ASTR|nr:unnamed protein product [Lactuca virosa]